MFFRDATEFRAWLDVHHDTATELWMGLNKKHVADRGLTWEDAVPEALCYGWIDSVSQRIDDDARRQRWTPRRPGSVWSSVNVALVERLTAEGRMQPAGLAAFERRRPERSGIYAYESAEHELDPACADQLAGSAAGDGVLARRDGVIPEAGHELGHVGEAAGDARPTHGAARRVLRDR